MRQDPRRAPESPTVATNRRGGGREMQLTSVFDLSDDLAAKADPALIAGDERHFAAIAESLEQTIADLSDRLDAARRAPGGIGQAGAGPGPGGAPADRAPAHPAPLRAGPVPRAHGRRGRRRARVRRAARPHRQRRAVGCWSTGAPPRPSRSSGRPTPTRWAWPAGAGTAGPGAGSATTGTRCSPPTGSTGTPPPSTTSPPSSPAWAASRSPRMRDVLGTIQADQDAIIRAGSRGALVVDGGPGTGKTVVALHRTAYLLYSDPRLGHRRGGVLFVGPHQPYLAYVADVLPSLGEEGVQTCTLRDLVPEGAARGDRDGPRRGPPEVVRGDGDGDRAGGPALRGAAHRGDGGRDPVVRRLAQRRRLGRGVRVAGPRHAAQRGARRGLGGAAHDPGRQARRRR